MKLEQRFVRSPAKLAQVMLAACVVVIGQGSARAQSVDRKAPAPLQAGVNTGTVDSLIGENYWYFWANPGHFQLRFGGGAARGLGASGRASIVAGFAPATPGSHITYQLSSDGGAVYAGSVTQRTRIGIGVNPPNSPLVRSTAAYSLEVSGSVAFDSSVSAPSAIVGMYTDMSHGPTALGAVKFNADGTLEATNGETGTWRVFDPASGTYVVNVSGRRISLRNDPGRGLVNMDGTIAFPRAH